ncbi:MULTISPECIES: hypothetical protein [unclassified Pseudomonas]|uniref:hypothetical protein n=1 Tax=unclassified Pseudomonas TaxID=196821 RepID=UPI001179C897|nr:MULTISPECIES: hypothetical protein [unclassified Pseudomonas]
MLPSLVPAFVRAVDRGRREIRVEIPPFTDGANDWPVAEMCYPIGDDSSNTEIRVVVGMPVWVAFRGGDERYPIIMGHRPVNMGNEVGTRRWNHDNIEHNSDTKHAINAGQEVVIEAGAAITLVVGGTSLKLTEASIAAIAQAHTIEGPVTQTGGDMTSDDISVQHHKHPTAALGTPSEPM